MAQLEGELLRERIGHETGVLPSMLTGTTEAAIRAAADVALAWRAEGQQPPRPATAAVSASTVSAADRIELPGQVTTRDQLSRMSPAERMRAYREGRLIHLGAGPPQPRSIEIERSPDDAGAMMSPRAAEPWHGSGRSVGTGPQSG